MNTRTGAGSPACALSAGSEVDEFTGSVHPYPRRSTAGPSQPLGPLRSPRPSAPGREPACGRQRREPACSPPPPPDGRTPRTEPGDSPPGTSADPRARRRPTATPAPAALPPPSRETRLPPRRTRELGRQPPGPRTDDPLFPRPSHGARALTLSATASRGLGRRRALLPGQLVAAAAAI